MIGGKINLASLTHVIQTAKSGQECIVIPVDTNKLFKSEKGNIYLDIIAFDVKNPAEGQKDTHIVKQSLQKEVREKMSEEELNAMPILGNLNANIKSGGEQEPQVAGPSLKEGEDLPF